MPPQTVTRPIGDSMSQMVRRNDKPPERFNCKIQRVGYVSRTLKVTARGYSGPKKVKVAQSIQLGTPDKPVVTTNSIAVVERQPEGRWLCIAVRRKQFCATGTIQADDVEVDTAFDTSSSFLTDGFPALVAPDDIFIPPIEALGQLTLPEFRFPDVTTFICGLPPCTDCGAPTVGKFLSISVDAEHPTGCYKWDFRQGGCLCAGNPEFASYTDLEAGLVNPSVGRMIPKGNYVFFTLIHNSGLTGRLVSVDASNEASPVILDTLDYSPVTSYVETFGSYVYLTGSDATDQLNIVDISNPSSMSLAFTYTAAEPLRANQIFSNGGNVYLATLYEYFTGSPNKFGLYIFNVTNPAAVTLVATITPTPDSYGWRQPSSGFVFPENNGWHIANSVFYTMLDIAAQIDIYNLADPTSPVLAAQFNTGYDHVSTVRANDTHLWVGAKKIVGTARYLVAYDISNPAVPVLVSETSTGLGASEEILSIALCGDYAFLAKNTGTTVKFETWDISTPATPVLVDTLTSPEIMRVPVHPLRVNGTNLYMAGSENLLTTQPRLLMTTC